MLDYESFKFYHKWHPIYKTFVGINNKFRKLKYNNIINNFKINKIKI